MATAARRDSLHPVTDEVYRELLRERAGDEEEDVEEYTEYDVMTGCRATEGQGRTRDEGGGGRRIVRPEDDPPPPYSEVVREEVKEEMEEPPPEYNAVANIS